MIPSLFSFAAMSLCSVAAIVAVWSFVRVRKLLRGASFRSLQQLSTAVDELTFASESLAASHKRLASRVGMRELRERKRDEASPEVDPSTDAQLSREKLKELARSRGHRVT